LRQDNEPSIDFEVTMPFDPKPIRRVVTGTDDQGRSCVLFDSAAPNVNTHVSARMTDLWVYPQVPAPISGNRDDGNLPFNFEPPHGGGHLRIVESKGRPADYDPAKDMQRKERHETERAANGTLYRGGQNAFSSPYHKSQTVDYGILLDGQRTLLLDDGAYPLKKGDVVVQLRNWHGWTNPDSGSMMAFVMMNAKEETP
jgi:quercetin dioxygenase-like cupin family protein